MIHIEECIKTPEPENFAILLYNRYKTSFRCMSIRRKHWQQFHNDMWKDVECAYPLYKVISNELLCEFESFILDVESKIINLRKKPEPDSKELIIANQKKVDVGKKILKLLKNITFKNKIIKEASFLFFVEN